MTYVSKMVTAYVSTEQFITDFKKKTGRLPSQVEISKELGLSTDKAVAALMAYIGTKKSETSTQERPHVPKSRVSVLQVGLFAVALCTFSLSVYFTGLWFLTMFSFPVAGTISISMVGYMVLSPQVADRVKGVVKVPLWATFGIALVFSMGSTVAGQYNQLTETVDVGQVNDRALLDSLRAEEEELLAAIAVDREQQLFHQQTLERLTQTAEDRMANANFAFTERAKVDELASDIEFKQTRLAEVRELIRAELQTGSTGATVERVDFYSWLGGFVGMNRSQMEFLISALPAIFIDIIAALSLNLALVVGGRK